MNRISLPKLKNARIDKDWTQEMLAEFSGLSVRTIQRIESGSTATLESAKSLSATLELNNYRSLMSTPEVDLTRHDPLEKSEDKVQDDAPLDPPLPTPRKVISSRDTEVLTGLASALRLSFHFFTGIIGLGIVFSASSHPEEALSLIISAIPYITLVGIMVLLFKSSNPKLNGAGLLLGFVCFLWLSWLGINALGNQLGELREDVTLLNFTSSLHKFIVIEAIDNSAYSETMYEALSSNPDRQKRYVDFIAWSKSEPSLTRCIEGLHLEMSAVTYYQWYLEHADKCTEE
jgi:transcriptional regulator with XRE-family HTH domain